MKTGYLFIFCTALLLAIVGCDGTGESNHPLFRKAQRARVDGKYEDAAEGFRKFLQNRPDSARTHLELATLYDENLKDPLTAIYHYQEYLRLYPDSPDKEMVTSWLESCKKRYAGTTQETPQEDSQLSVLQEENEQLKKELEAKQRELQSRPQVLPQQVVTVAEQPPEETPKKAETPPAIPEWPKEYQVRPGDSFSALSRKFYGTIKYHNHIMQYNQFKSPKELKAGKTIQIPAPPVNE